MIEGIPEAFETTGLGTRHTEVVAEAREVGLTRQADRHVVGDVVRRVSGTTIVTCGKSMSVAGGEKRSRTETHTVSLVVTRSNHVRLMSRDRRDFIIVLVQKRLIDLGTLFDGGVGEEALDFLLQPVVRVGNITRYMETT